MRTIILTCAALLCAQVLMGQTETQPGEWIIVNIDVTDSITNRILGSEGVSKLENKVIRIISSNGAKYKISCVRNNSPEPGKTIRLGELNTGILCKTKFELYDEAVVNTGMEKMTVVKINLSLFIQSVKGNVIFGEYSGQYAATGKNKQEAIRNVLANIDIKDSRFNDFLKESRLEVGRYYEQMCESIIEQATALAKFKRFTDAIYLLWPIPSEVKCHREARDTMLAIYVNYVNYNCKDMLLQARSYIATKDYKLAMDQLRSIDPEASCAEDAIAVMKEISIKVDEQEKKYYEIYSRIRENEVDLERERYRAIANMNTTFSYNNYDVNVKDRH